MQFESADPDQDFEDLLYISLGVEFSNLGFSSLRNDSGSPKSQYRLLTEYEFRETEADVSLTLFREEHQVEELSAVDFLLPVDTTFEGVLADNVRRLMSSADLDTTADEKAKPEIGGLFRSNRSILGDSTRYQKTVRLETGLTVGGMLFMGGFSEYSKLGIYSSVRAGALFLKPGWSISAGGRASFTPALMADGVSGGPVYLTTIGANVQFGLGSAKKFKLSGGVSGGAAFITLTGFGESVTKAVPYVDAGLLAVFPLGRDLFLGGEVNFLAVLDPDLPIIGLSPSIAVSMEF